MSGLPFVKMHGLGNDFVVIDDVTPARRPQATPLTPALARQLADRRLGVGADQVLWLRPATPASGGAEFRMEIFNTDGSTAEMCGNGIRAAALLWRRRTGTTEKHCRVETLAGTLDIELKDEHSFRVGMGAPILGAAGVAGEQIEAGGRRFHFIEVDMGNPHAVIFVPKLADVLLDQWGPALERHPRFLKRTNVEFVEVVTRKEVRVRVWERGAGATLACGTGACAVAAAAIASGQAQSPLRVVLPGGALELEWQGPGTPIFMTGPATLVFEGVFEGVFQP